MFSIIFPGQGSQNIGMAKELYQNFDYVRGYFSKANEILNTNLSRIIFDGPEYSTSNFFSKLFNF